MGWGGGGVRDIFLPQFLLHLHQIVCKILKKNISTKYFQGWFVMVSHELIVIG